MIGRIILAENCLNMSVVAVFCVFFNGCHMIVVV